MPHLVYLDRYHQDDVLYIDQLGRILKGSPTRPSLVFFHGSGEEAERVLEAEAVVPRRLRGRLEVADPALNVLIEREVRHANQRVVARLTEAGVPAVGFQGSDRGLLRAEASGLTARVGWLGKWIERGAVPVVSALAPSERGVLEVEPAAALVALAEALGASVVFLTKTNRPGVLSEGEPQAEIATEQVESSVFPEADVLRAVVLSGQPCYLTNAGGILQEPASGTRVTR